MTNTKMTLLLGAHMSTAGGIHIAIERGQEIGCTAIQLFTKSNRQWAAKPLADEEIDTFKNCWKSSSIESIIAHAAYIINIASTNHDIAFKSKNSLLMELNRCSQLGIPYLVLHPGSALTNKMEASLEHVASILDSVLEKSEGKVTILLETMAGQGSVIGYTFEQLAIIYEKSTAKDHLGFCLDTCHIFAAGYDIRSQEAYEKTIQNFDTTLGLENLKAIHVNDSQKECGSRVDRHAAIGTGKIGFEGFNHLVNDERLFKIPKILETPVKEADDYLKNMRALGNLISGENRKKLIIRVP